MCSDWFNDVLFGIWRLNQTVNSNWWQWCWWHRYVDDLYQMLVAESLCWQLFSLCWWFSQCIKLVTNISNLSPTHLVSNIRHQHWCNHGVSWPQIFLESPSASWLYTKNQLWFQFTFVVSTSNRSKTCSSDESSLSASSSAKQYNGSARMFKYSSTTNSSQWAVCSVSTKS